MAFSAIAVESAGDVSGNVVVRHIPSTANQGVAVDATHYYAISNTTIVKGDKITGVPVATWKADRAKPAFRHFTHLNSGTVVDGRLYCAHSRFAIDPNDNTVEIWDVAGAGIEHLRSIPMPRTHGSLTWIDRHADAWWMCYAVYGAGVNENTRLIRYRADGDRFIEERIWRFPAEVVHGWGKMSCSGGSWGPDGLLYVTGHDHPLAYVLEADEAEELKLLRVESGVGFQGQAIAWDRFTMPPRLWGIIKGKGISLTAIARSLPP